MTQREKLFVLISVIFISYGLYDFSVKKFSRSSKTPSISKDSLNEFIEKMDKDLKTGELGSYDLFLLSNINDSAWSNPFHQPSAAASNLPLQSEILPVYSGYIFMGTRYIAIIDGEEYETGNVLKSGAWMVVDISPKQITIEKQSVGRKHIPIEERGEW